jgi:Spy/CpxP family protein refolding chaperone
MRTMLTILATAFALVAIAPVSSPAQGKYGGAGVSAGLDTTGLGLSADQQAKWNAIRDDLRTKNAPLRDQARQMAGGKSFRDLSDAEREALRPKLQPIMDQMRENARKAREQAEAVLTPAQKQKFEARIKERMERGGGPPH